MDNNDNIKIINKIYSDFKIKLGDIFNKKKILLKIYHSKIEEAKIKEVHESLNNISK